MLSPSGNYANMRMISAKTHNHSSKASADSQTDRPERYSNFLKHTPDKRKHARMCSYRESNVSVSGQETAHRDGLLKRTSGKRVLTLAAKREYIDELSSSYDDEQDFYDDAIFRSDIFFEKLDKLQENSKDLGTEDVATVANTTDSSSGSDIDIDSLEENVSKMVRFSTVSIRTYAITVGTHTHTRAYPLTLDWHHTATETIDLQLFEDTFSSARTKPVRKTTRGFRRPQRIKPAMRFYRIVSVTGEPQEYIYELEQARTRKENEIPHGACHSDDGYVEDDTRAHPYQLCDVDDYQVVEC